MKETQGQPITAVTKLASERFKALGDEERAAYQKKYEEAKAKFEEDMKAFLEAGGEKKARKTKGSKAAEKLKRKKDCTRRKPNRSAFADQCKGQPVTAVTKLASEKWKALSEEEKKVFEEEYQTKKAAYEEAMKSYVPLPSAEAEEPPAKKARMSKEQKEAAKEAAKEAKESSKKEKQEAKAKQTKEKAKAKAVKPKAKGKPATTPEVELQATVAAKAEKVGLKDQLMKLVARDDIKASGKSQTAALKALEESNGLIHPARFLAEKRPELMKETQGQPITAVTKLASERFKALGDEERAAYQKKYEEAKAKFEEDMKAFLEAGGEKKARKSKEEKVKPKKEKDPEAPKRPAGGAYGCFLAKHRAAFAEQCKGKPVTAVTKLASEKWKALSDEEKKVFEAEYKAKKSAYDEAMKSYAPKPTELIEPPAKKAKALLGA
ncbi:unnamed protein product [Effrenium voratum]|uniref:HMG box domain-containing protein n=1 Tax=Effrenium voratum TaxID=2562239 RepID=A0AA36MNF1_9DINO|nr:unnamed protein product [Effrenium voratum]